jgi:hypothetical protein
VAIRKVAIRMDIARVRAEQQLLFAELWPII